MGENYYHFQHLISRSSPGIPPPPHPLFITFQLSVNDLCSLHHERDHIMITFVSNTLYFDWTGQPNVCSMSPVVISEIKLDGDQLGFIELYDGGHGSTPLDSLLLVLYDYGEMNPTVYSVQSLLGHSTNMCVNNEPQSSMIWNIQFKDNTK